MVKAILDAHPNISCGPETGFLQGLHRWERRHPDIIERFDSNPRDFHVAVGELLADLHRRRALSQAKPRWADKTPSHALCLEYIDALYPDCQVLHIVRDPVDVVDSKRRKHDLRTAWRSRADWAAHVRSARAFGAAHPPDRYRQVRYEDLVRQPERELRALFAWLGEPWHPGVLGFRTHPPPEQVAPALRARPSYRGDRPPGTFTSSVGSGHRHLGSLLVAAGIAWSDGELMRSLGYRWWPGPTS
jgi:hypothetical protein